MRYLLALEPLSAGLGGDELGPLAVVRYLMPCLDFPECWEVPAIT